MIWTREGSPLKVYTARQASKLQELLGERGHEDVEVAMAMRYGSPSIASVVGRLAADGIDEVLLHMDSVPHEKIMEAIGLGLEYVPTRSKKSTVYILHDSRDE